MIPLLGINFFLFFLKRQSLSIYSGGSHASTPEACSAVCPPQGLGKKFFTQIFNNNWHVRNLRVALVRIALSQYLEEQRHRSQRCSREPPLPLYCDPIAVPPRLFPGWVSVTHLTRMLLPETSPLRFCGSKVYKHP